MGRKPHKERARYREGDPVEIAIAGDTSQIITGKVCGAVLDSSVDFWIIRLDERLPYWDYSCLPIMHKYVRPAGDLSPFPCEQN